MRRLTILLVFAAAQLPALVLASVATASAPGSLDTTFGGSGMVTTSYSGAVGDETAGVAQQSTGALITVGSIFLGSGNDVGVVSRFATDGSLDATFGTAGTVQLEASATVGHYTQFTAVGIDSSDRIYVAGRAITAANSVNQVVARLSPSGTLDATYGVGGWAIVSTLALGASNDEELNALHVEGDGTAYLGGSNMNNSSDLGVATVAKLTSAGVLDTAFDGDGIRTFDLASVAFGEDLVAALSFDGGGQLVAAGSYGTGSLTERTFVARIDPATGGLDTTFDTDGILPVDIGPGAGDIVSGLAAVGDDLVISGYEDTIGEAFSRQPAWLARIDANGDLVGTFGTAGVVRHLAPDTKDLYAAGLVADSHGRLLVGVRVLQALPNEEIGAIRIDAATGSLDTSFGAGGWALTDTPTDGKLIRGLFRQADGDVVAHGYDVDSPAFPDAFMARFIASDAPVVPDTTPPAAPVIAGAPASPTTSTTATLTFSSELGATFVCSLDGAAFTACTSPLALTGLSVGSHVFRVKALDAASNLSVVSEVSWTIAAVTTPVTPDPTTPAPPKNPPLAQVTLPAGPAARIGTIARTGVLPVQLPLSIPAGTNVRARLIVSAAQARALGLRVPPRARTVVIGTGAITAGAGKAGPRKLTLRVQLNRPAKAAFGRAVARGSKVRSIATTINLVLTRNKVSAKPLNKPFTLRP
jgi:uncharacterized delta-60 repeat protein